MDDSVVVKRHFHKGLKVLVDLDDTIWDLVGHWICVLNHTYKLEVQREDIKDWDIAAAFPTLTKTQVFQPLSADGFWRGIQAIEDSAKVLKKLIEDGYDVYIVTATSYKTSPEKMEHLFELFPFLDWDHVIIAQNKNMICGDVIVDDNPKNLQDRSDGSLRILFDRTHNMYIDTDKYYKMIRLKTWEEILVAIETVSAIKLTI